MSEIIRSALVTGGNRGLGFEIARQLGLKGFKIYIGVRDAAKGDAAVKKLGEAGIQAQVIPLDVSDEKSILAAYEMIRAQTDRLDVLINNAGILLEQKEGMLTVSADALLRSFQVNTLGPILLARTFLPLLEKGHRAQIVNITSGMGEFDAIRFAYDAAAYRLSKTALNAATLLMTNDFAKKAVAVNAVCPGWVRTDMGGPNAERTPEQGADTAVWLALGNAEDTGGYYRDRKMIDW